MMRDNKFTKKTTNDGKPVRFLAKSWPKRNTWN